VSRVVLGQRLWWKVISPGFGGKARGVRAGSPPAGFRGQKSWGGPQNFPPLVSRSLWGPFGFFFSASAARRSAGRFLAGIRYRVLPAPGAEILRRQRKLGMTTIDAEAKRYRWPDSRLCFSITSGCFRVMLKHNLQAACGFASDQPLAASQCLPLTTRVRRRNRSEPTDALRSRDEVPVVDLRRCNRGWRASGQRCRSAVGGGRLFAHPARDFAKTDEALRIRRRISTSSLQRPEDRRRDEDPARDRSSLAPASKRPAVEPS